MIFLYWAKYGADFVQNLLETTKILTFLSNKANGFSQLGSHLF